MFEFAPESISNQVSINPGLVSQKVSWTSKKVAVIPNPDVELNGLLLTFTAYVSTYLSFFSVFFVFSWFNCEPNWFIITPIMIALWFYFSPALFNRHFNSGAAHWGMLLSIIIFLSSL